MSDLFPEPTPWNGPPDREEDLRRSTDDRQILCANCGHSKQMHWDRYGCVVERGDQLMDGCLTAMGPCGCMDWEPE